MDIGKIEIVPIRQAFGHEAANFTVWMEKNIDALSERIGIKLTVLEAKTAIWVATEARPEHQRVIDWLNEVTDANTSFYFVKVEAIRIGSSPYAPLFTVLSRPDEQTREIGEQKKELAERHGLRKEFWSQLLERSRLKTDLGSSRSPTHDYWLGLATGRSGINYNYLILKDGAAIDLYIDVSDYEKNKAIFDELLREKAAIETEFGEPLEWRRLDDKRATRIVYALRNQGSLRERDSWDALQDTLIDAMIRFDNALRKRIRRINL